MRDNHKNKIIHFCFLKSANIVLLAIIIVSLLLTGIVALILNAQGKFSNTQDLSLVVLVIVNVFLISLPLVLFVLCIILSAIFTLNLSKKNVSVNKLSRLESLPNINVLCLEKENVIVDGTLVIKKIVPLKTVATEQYINQWLSNMLRATNDAGAVFDTLNKQFDFELSAGLISVLHYSDELKYSGASFKGGKTIVLGNPEFVPIKNKIGILKRCEEDITKGCRILVVAEGKEQITDSGYHGELEAIALVVLKDHIRDDAFETFKWFKDNGIDIKVISSDDALVTSVNAAEAGIEGSDKYISLLGIENIDNLVFGYSVFGDASPAQKEEIISVIKRNQQVMMVGGNSGDVPAMKASNFAVATINNDADSLKSADAVLEGPSLNSLTTLINNSKTFMNNLRKALSLTITKTVFTFVTVLFFVLFNSSLKQCLFVFNHLLLWDLIINGVAVFLLMRDKNTKNVNSVLRSAVPAAILQIAGALTMFVIYALQSNQLLSTGVYSMDNVAAMCVLMFNILGMVSLYNVCVPLNRHRRIAFIAGSALNVFAVGIVILLSYLSNNVEIPYLSMNWPAYFLTAVIAILYSAIYLFIARLISIIKGDNLKNEN